MTLSSAITVCFEILPCVFSGTVFRCFRYPYFHCPCVNLGLAWRRQLPRCRFWATEKSLKNLSTKIWGSQNGPHMGLSWLLHHWADHIVGLSMSSQACKRKMHLHISSQWKWVTLNCFNDKCLRNFTIGSVSYLQLTGWEKLHDPRSLVLLLRRSPSSCAWIWGIRPDTKCDHLRCCVCGPFLNVVHLVLYFNSSCSHAPNALSILTTHHKPRSAEEPCQSHRITRGPQ